MKDLTAFRPHVSPYVSAAVGRQLVDDAILHSAKELCEKALVWREDLTPIDIDEGIYTYPLTPPAGRIVTVIYALYDTVPINPTGEDELDKLSPSWRRYRSITYRYYLDMQDDQVNMELTWPPNTDITGGLEVKVALKPLNDDTTVPDILYQEYLETVADGALAKLLSMQSQKWYDVKRATRYAMSYGSGIAQAKMAADRSHTRRARTVTMRPMVRGRIRRWW